MTLNIRSRLFLWFIFISVIPLILIGGFSYYLIVEKISTQYKETLTNINNGILNMVDTQRKVLSKWLENNAIYLTQEFHYMGKHRFDYSKMVKIGNFNLPTWHIGKTKISNNNDFSDKMLEEKYMAFTMFQLHGKQFVRVSSNVRRPDGARILGSTLIYPHIYKKVIRGKVYLGRANVEGVWHATIYYPIKDEKGKIIGAFSLGRPEQEYELVQAIKKIKVGKTGYVFVMDPQGNMIIHPTLQGSNQYDKEWVRDIIKNKNGSLTYRFNNRKKIVYFIYYKPWNWYIVTGSYVSEIFNTPTKLSKFLLVTIIFVVLISMLIAYIISKNFSIPINNLMHIMEQAQKGDLSVRLNYSYYREFKILDNTFKAMLDNISNLIGRIGNNSTELKDSSKYLIDDINASDKSLKKLDSDVEQLQQKLSSLNDPEGYNKIANLRIEVQKLNLLLKNIYNSASKLDSIALSLDRHVKFFIIEDNKYEK